MRYFLLLLLGLLAGPLRAQPGGGGGLRIGRVFAVVAGRPVPVDSAALRVRTFLLASPDSVADTFGARVQYETYEPDFRELPSSNYAQRLYLIYRADTMLLDVRHIIAPNGAGYRDYADSLVIMPGHFSLAAPRSSLTPTTRRKLLATPALRYRRHLNLRFLAPRYLPASFYTAQGVHLLKLHQPDSALASLARAAARGSQPQADPSFCSLLANAYNQRGQYALAADWASRAIALDRPQLRRSPSDPDYWATHWRLQHAYGQRQRAYLRQRRYLLALLDYDSTAALERRLRRQPPTRQDSINRAFFQADSLHQPAGYQQAAALLRAGLPAAPVYEWSCLASPSGSDYAYDYWRLALAEYRLHQEPAAFRHWAQALTSGLAHEWANDYVLLFDTLLARHPRQPELLLGRAAALLGHDHRRQPAQQTTAAEEALRTLAQARQAGLSDFRVPFYQARALAALRRLPDAHHALSLAIQLNPTEAGLYQRRYKVREQLGEATFNDPADPDLAAAQRLCPPFTQHPPPRPARQAARPRR